MAVKEVPMARAVISSHRERRAACEPLYEIDPRTGASIEVFYADQVLAKSFGACEGWFHWSCGAGNMPQCPPVGPFPTSYGAYRHAFRGSEPTQFGRRITTR
jgi:hypothetical protein